MIFEGFVQYILKLLAIYRFYRAGIISLVLKITTKELTMGKNEIPIELIKNDTKRRTTFAKRHLGVQKKAHELLVLCNARVALIYFDENDELYTFSST